MGEVRNIELYPQKLSHEGVQGNAMTVPQILARLRQVYGPLTNKDLEDATTRMSTYIKLGQDVEEFITIHEEAHSLYEEADTAMTENNKVQTMTTALKGCDAYEPFTMDFYKDHRVVAEQTFELLCQELREYQVPTRFTTSQSLSAASAQVTNKSGKKRSRREDDDRRSHRPRAGWLYCHTHGLVDHDSAHCPEKASGHKDAATIDNRMGGSTKFVPGPVIKGEKYDPTKRTKRNYANM